MRELALAILLAATVVTAATVTARWWISRAVVKGLNRGREL